MVDLLVEGKGLSLYWKTSKRQATKAASDVVNFEDLEQLDFDVTTELRGKI